MEPRRALSGSSLASPSTAAFSRRHASSVARVGRRRADRREDAATKATETATEPTASADRRPRAPQQRRARGARAPARGTRRACASRGGRRRRRRRRRPSTAPAGARRRGEQHDDEHVGGRERAEERRDEPPRPGSPRPGVEDPVLGQAREALGSRARAARRTSPGTPESRHHCERHERRRRRAPTTASATATPTSATSEPAPPRRGRGRAGGRGSRRRRAAGGAAARRARRARSPRRRATPAAAASRRRRARRTRARAGRPRGGAGSRPRPRARRRAPTRSSAPSRPRRRRARCPRTPASQSRAIARLWSASPTMRTSERDAREPGGHVDRDERQAEVDDPHRARGRARAGRPGRAGGSPAPTTCRRGRRRGPRARSGSQCTSGSRVCTSIGNQRFGVVRNTRRPTRSASRDERPLALAAADVLDHRVRVDDVEGAVGERERARVALDVGDARGSRSRKRAPSWSPSAVIRSGHG